MTRQEINTHIGQCIRYTRKQNRMTQTKLAYHVGIRPQNVSDYEKGIKAPRITTLYNIARTLKVEMADLLPSLEQVKEQ